MTTKSRANTVTLPPKTRWMYMIDHCGELRTSILYPTREVAEEAMRAEAENYGADEWNAGDIEMDLYEVASAFTVIPTLVQVKFDYKKL